MDAEVIKKLKQLLNNRDITNQRLAFEILDEMHQRGETFMPHVGKAVLDSAQKLRWLIERKWNFVLEAGGIHRLDLERWQAQPRLPGHILHLPTLRKVRFVHFDWDGQLPEVPQSLVQSLFFYGMYQFDKFPVGCKIRWQPY